MKNVFIIVAIASVFAACQGADTNGQGLTKQEKEQAIGDTANFTTMEWIDSTYQDLGKVKEGQVVEVSYRFRNTGNHNLVIADVTAGCGCTTPDKPQEPILPGKEGVIKARFDSKSRPGSNTKSVYVRANTHPLKDMTLTFKVDVTE